MSDFNLFEVGGKCIRRTGEALEDAYNATEQVFTNSFPMSMALGNKRFWSGLQSEHILQQAVNALDHKDIDETAHQLHRDVYFCSLFPAEAQGPTERAALAGLAAIEKHQPVEEIRRIIDIPSTATEK